ncbi:AraC family transcriptional regulator [Corallococcus macrosporus]|uniref:AraC family transcriptional regulator n=1 Tax=Corallococcus macrosporus DSM 14697 TaxID=1189310 RepID=A0A250K3N3_9BACT|nr:AraC family transcriptional regulator [Corallococcus macrosporus]ATB50312.1 AraC family transcriptional regulator [Corallococcus macrosporus DSM 14697]
MERHTPADGIHPTAIPRVFLIRAARPSEPLHALHEPALCIVAQGRKQVLLADELFVYGPEQCLVVSVDLPVTGQVIEATPRSPYLCLRVDLDPGQLSAVMLEAALEPSGPKPRGPGMSLSPAEPALLDAATRLVRLLDSPRDISFLAPLFIREMVYRLLASDHGARLRHIALAGERLDSVNRAITWLKHHYTEPLRIEQLARVAHMSTSALHHHFKSLTAMSPLQYQKHLRLQEARRLMLGQALDAASAGHSVGYESPSQFNREYSRLFGAPPARDISRLRGTLQGHAQRANAST